MIVGLLLDVLGVILSWLGSVLPSANLSLDFAANLGTWIGEKAGPLDHVIPMVPLAQCLVVWFTIWLPASRVYVITFWVYRHLPVVGKG